MAKKDRSGWGAILSWAVNLLLIVGFIANEMVKPILAQSYVTHGALKEKVLPIEKKIMSMEESQEILKREVERAFGDLRRVTNENYKDIQSDIKEILRILAESN